MDEAQIVESLKQNVPQTEAFVPAEPDQPIPPDGTTVTPQSLDELTQFKMHDYFGEQYRGSNEDNKERLQFIFDAISEQLGERDYIRVMSRVNELEMMIGTAHSENRIYKLYQWLGLDQVRRNAEKSMRLINAGR